MPFDEEAGWRQLHPTSVLFTAWKSLKQFIPALIFAWIAADAVALGFQAFAGLALFFTVAHSLAYQALYRYQLGDRELVVREGVLSRTVRHVPYGRIQNVNLVQNLLHRALGVYRVQLESASGSTPEAVMPALSADAIRELQDRVDSVRPASSAGSDETAAEEPRTLLELGFGELVRLGLVSWRGMVVAGAVAGFLAQFGDRLPIWDRLDVAERINQVTASNLAADWLHTLVQAVVVIAVIMVVLTGFSIALAIVRYHGFRLERRGPILRTTFGLLTRVSNTIPSERIQLVTISQGMIQRLMGRQAVHVETAGQMDHAEGGDTGISALAPIVTRAATPPILQAAHPDVDWAEPDWIELHPRAGRRLARRRLRILAVVTLAVALIWSWWALLLLLPAPMIWYAAHRWARYSGVALTPTAILYRSGWLSRATSVVRFRKGQTVTIQTSPFDRRWRMATLAVDTAGARPTGHRLVVPYLDADAAEQLHVFVSERLNRTRFRW